MMSIISDIYHGKTLNEVNVRSLCAKVSEIFSQEPNVLNLEVPITVCGDIHGQLPDLLELFQVAGDLPWQKYLFLGDYVDRGYNSTEVFLLLLSLKVAYPHRVFLIRGNHELKEITTVYGFYDEVLRKYGCINIWRSCVKVFEVLPISAVIVGQQKRVFCVHGGLSPDIPSIDDISLMDRMKQKPEKGLSDLLWSDPEDSVKGWEDSPRGAGYLFGEDVCTKFRNDNAIDYLARAHQLVDEGFKWHFQNTVLTVWSAPNYCYRCGNLASIYEISEDDTGSFTLFEASPEVNIKHFIILLDVC